MNKQISIAEPQISNEEINEVTAVLKSAELAQGKWVEEFENSFAKYCHTKYAVALANGTCALHLALLALGIRQGDEVITTPFTFIASSNAILYTGAKPVFVDIDPKTFNIDPDKIEQNLTSRTRAILPVHLYGLPADMDKILKIAKRHKLYVLEDAAQAHGAKIGNQMVGSFGDLAAFSFYPTKNMTTGEGGMITTNNFSLAKKIRKLRNHGMEIRYHHDILGFNFRMTNMAAAIGIHQLRKLNKFNEQRAENAQFLTKQLFQIQEIETPFVPANFLHVYHQYTILVKNGKERDRLVEYLRRNGVATMIYYPIPVHKQKFMLPMYPNLHLKNAETAAERVLSLPIHPAVKKEDLTRIGNIIRRFFLTNNP